jgi:2,4-dienoyl-CoA reductase-like NADH-dependent reductase (Old Yellow Enzyme family)/thioredoxin reductase
VSVAGHGDQATHTSQFERLFSPLQVGPMTVPNRICETTNTIGAGRAMGVPDDPFVEHHLAKARGGTGWIGNETWLLDSPLPAGASEEFFPGVGAIRFPLYLLPNFVEEVAKFVDAVHDAGSVAVFQLTQLNFTMAASPVPLAEPYDWVPHQLDHSEIEAILDTYVMAAGQFLAAGADGIEIHCAHETLPQSFLSPALNHRTDRWGGDAGGRTRFVTELLGRLRERIGADMALGIRICGQEFREGGYDLMEMREMITLIAATDTLDFVNVDVGHSWGSPSYVQPSYYDHAQYREVGRAIRADVAPIPTLFSGRVNDPVVAEELLAKGVCDLVGMTRAGIADPEFANKAREGRLIEIRRCIGCNRCIADSIESHAPEMFRKPTCSVNPVVGREIEWRYVRPASPSKRVVVVGGGAAGLELARVAAGRGHELIVLERAAALGGQLRIAARAPGRDAFEDFIYYEEHQMELLDVDLRLGVEADLDSVLALEPDVVACATGSVPRVPRTPGVDADHVVQGWDVLAGTAEVRGRVAVVSQEDHFETPNVVDFLASAGAEVEVFHKWTGIGSQIDRYSIGPILGRIHTHDVPVHTGWRLGEVAGRDLRFTSAFTGKGRTFPGFDSVVLVYGSVPDTSLYDQLGGRVPQRHLVGSAWVPRRLAEATQHGARLGTEL